MRCEFLNYPVLYVLPAVDSFDDQSASHVCGYTPFRLRLDNITAVK